MQVNHTLYSPLRLFYDTIIIINYQNVLDSIMNIVNQRIECNKHVIITKNILYRK